MHFTVEKKNAKKLIKQNKSNFRKMSKELVQQMGEKKNQETENESNNNSKQKCIVVPIPTIP